MIHRPRRGSGFRRSAILLSLLLVLFLSAALASADVRYFYDELGRLVVVLDESTGQAATYTYDAVGNILAITRSTITVAAPQLDAIVPDRGDTGSTVRVTLTGRNLLLTQSVTTDNPGITVGAFSETPEEVRTSLSIASGAREGTTLVTVTTPNGSASIGFTVEVPIALTRLTPTQGEAGTPVAIEGTGFVATVGTPSVTFSGPGGTRVAAPLTSAATATRLDVNVPLGSVPGLVIVTRANKTSNSLTFTVLGPHVASVNPADNATNVPRTTSVTVTFSNPIDPATVTASTFTVSTGGTPIDGTRTATSTTATFTPAAPLGFEQLHTVSVTAGILNPEGLPISPFTSRFTTEKAPTTNLAFDGITATATTGTPADLTQASANVGQVLTIRGRNLSTLVTLETARFANGALQATPVTYSLTNVSPDATQAQVTLLSFTGTGLTRLRSPAELAPESHLLQIVPRLTSVSLPFGASFTAGTTLTLSGSGFTSDMRVRFPLAAGGTVEQPIVAGTVGSANTSASVVIPAGVGSGLLTVVTPGGVATGLTIPGLTRLENPDGTLARAATGTPADPAQASTNGDQLLVVRGSGLASGMALRVPRAVNGTLTGTFDVTVANVSPDGTRAEVTVPKLFNVITSPGAPITDQVRLVQVSTGVQSPQTLLLQIVPTLTSVTLPAGATFSAGQTLTLNGNTFTAAMTVRFPLLAGGTVDQPIVAGSVSQLGNQAQVVIPASVGPGFLQPVTTGGVAQGLTLPALTRLENPDGTLARAATGTPADPAQASTNGDQLLVVRGSGLASGMALRVPRAVNGTLTGTFDVTVANASPDGTRAEVTVPKLFNVISSPGAPITGQVRIVQFSTGVQSPQSLLLQIVPTLTSVSLPAGASFTAGQTLTLNGSAFTAAMTVRFPLAAGGTVDQPIVAGSVSQLGNQAQVVIPAGVGPGFLQPVTTGGVAQGLILPGLTRLENPDGTLARAATGTPADPAQASTNGDQLLVVRGSGLASGMALRVPRAVNGTLTGTFDVTVANVSPDGTRAEVTVPKLFNVITSPGAPITGQVRLVQVSTGVQSPETLLFQIVPTLTSVSLPFGATFTAGQTLTLNGNTFTAAMTVRFPLAAGGTVDQPIVAGSVSQLGNQAQVVIPSGAVKGPTTVITPGGESNAITPP